MVKVYPKYKDLGVSWLGQVPEHWDNIPGRACFCEKKDSNKGLKEKTVLSLSYGQIVVKPEDKLHGLVPASFETYQVVDPLDIICRPTDLQNDWVSLRFGISRNRGIITSAYICLKTSDNFIPEFGYFLLHVYDLKKVFYGLGSGVRQNLDWRDFKYLPCLLPPIEEQKKIVSFINYINQAVKRYIRSKQQIIKFLNEQKQATINKAVTRGIDLNIRLKPSGVDWLGDIPEHWKIARFKHFYSVRMGQTFLRPDLEEKGDLPVLSATMSDAVLGYTNRKNAVMILNEGDLVIPARGNSIGYVTLVNSRCTSTQTTIQAKKRHGDQLLSSKFAHLFCIGNRQFLFQFVQTAIPQITTKEVSSNLMLLPPRREQDEIVEFIEKECSSLNVVIKGIEDEIVFLREYRTRLIFDVVTGKIDVRDIKLPESENIIDPEPIEEQEILDDIEDTEEVVNADE